MQHDVLTDFFAGLVSLLAEADMDGRQTHPGTLFNKAAKAGKFRSLGNDEYDAALAGVNSLSHVIWNGQVSISTQELVRRAFKAAQLDETDLHLIGGLLANGFERANDVTPRAGQDVSVQLPFDLPQRTVLALSGEAPLGVQAMTPKQIYAEFDRRVWKQNAAKRAVSTLLYHHVHGHARALVIAGPTGSGKSLIMSVVSELYPNVVDVDGSQLTAEGYKGEVKFGTIFKGMTKDAAEHALVVVDEADKLFEAKPSSEGNYSFQIQNELLKLMDGGNTKTQLSTDKNDAPVIINTSCISWVFLGSFETMVRAKSALPNGIGFGGDVRARRGEDYEATFTSEDLVQHAGVRREVAGRIGQIVQVLPLNVDDYLHILDDPDISPLARLEREYNRTIDLTDAEKYELAKSALDAGLGVRSMSTSIMARLDEDLFENGPAEAPDLDARPREAIEDTDA